MYIYQNNRIPFFSVILTTYDRGYIIDRAINSVLNQTEQDWELLIVDDGSKDNTFEVCSKYFNDGRIRFLFHKNKGLPLSRNVGILSSSGLYCTFLDSDDEYKENHLEFRRNILLQHPEVDLLYGGVEIMGDPYVVDYYDNSKLIHIDECYVGGSFFVKKNVAIDLGGFRNIKYGDDVDFAKRAIEEGYCVASVEYRTYIYHRDVNDSISKLYAQSIKD